MNTNCMIPIHSKAPSSLTCKSAEFTCFMQIGFECLDLQNICAKLQLLNALANAGLSLKFTSSLWAFTNAQQSPLTARHANSHAASSSSPTKTTSRSTTTTAPLDAACTEFSCILYILANTSTHANTAWGYSTTSGRNMRTCKQ